ncbi:IMPACT family protein [Coralliovum pocilloporae]|uniref:IMPACT family protein n=1 Tax=Coralliovum pocilloporae TaxID=3066369 RepID=UPI003306E483
MSLYTVQSETIAELEDRKSRFLAYLVPYADFARRLDELRTDEHPKANHHVTAFRHMLEDGRIDEGAKDDGEPSGTSGMPVLKVLHGANLVDTGVIVVRYFGGTKLGGGGLVRAYSGAAKRAIEDARLVPWLKMVRRTVDTDFADASALENKLSALENVTVEERTYTETGVTFALYGPEQDLSGLQS